MAEIVPFLYLPPMVRLSVFSRCLSAGLHPPSATAATHGDASCLRNWRTFPVLQLRGYATVDSRDTDMLWKEDLSQPPSGTTAQPPRPTSTDMATVKSSKTSAVQDQADLLTVLRKRIRSRPARQRSALRNKVNFAMKSPSPVTALRALAAGQPLPKLQETSHGRRTENMISSTLLDLEYVQKAMALPTSDHYPTAAPDLFNARTVSVAIHQICTQLKLSIQVDVDFSTKPLPDSVIKSLPNGPQDMHECSLKLDIPDICQETAIGQGYSKQAARQSAWLHVVGKMHTNGTLKELFSGSSTEAQLTTPNLLDDQLEPTNLDKQTLEEEKDAKSEIYNYAAGFGVVPQFEVELIQPRMPRARRARQAKKTTPVVQVTINLSKPSLRASAVGRNLRTAEIAAALDFKRRAEEVRDEVVDALTAEASRTSSLLNTDNAHYFFELYKEIKPRVQLEVESEQISVAGVAQHAARLMINDEPIGQRVTMQAKKSAASVAYLAAAVEIVGREPSLLQVFEQRLKKDKGKVLRPLASIDLPVDAETLHIMRNALLEAREAGLPDTHAVLSAAEDLTTSETPRQRRRPLESTQIDALSKQLQNSQREFAEDPALEDLRQKKAALPMNQYRSQVLDMVSRHPYSIVVGSTGSGKTTQVPQILLEDAIAKGHGGACNIICTQPRRIAATSVAQRVADERDEPLQRSIGHHVRFDAKLPKMGGSITYCTTGILLEQLKHDPDSVLDSATHLVVDEVHERDLNIDFLMIVLKNVLQARAAALQSVPKVVLMSATLDIELFSNYFSHRAENGDLQPCPSLSVPGRTFPVKEKFLGSIVHEMLQAHRSEFGALINEDKKSREFLQDETAFSSSQTPQSSSRDSTIDWRRERQHHLEMDEFISPVDEKKEALVPCALLAATIAHICETTEEGAILAFVPGLEEILQTQRFLQERRVFGIDFLDSAKFKILPLHSTVPKDQQSEIFKPTPKGCRKIILSTNIAETSVTVTDVKYVVDTGKLRETRYDQSRRITKLQCVWESKSNSKQRAGRAGRVQDGHYYALFSKERHEFLRAAGLPELLRSDLQDTCLSIKSQNFTGSVASFLAQAIEPPLKSAVNAAVTNLVDIEAFTEDERLTDLGRLLSRLPVHPTLGKMIILGVIFRCLDPMLVFGAAANERSLFVTPIGGELRARADSFRRSYADGTGSDHLAMLEAFKELRMLRNQYGVNAAFERGRENFLHVGAFKVIDQTAQQILQVLVESGVIPADHRGETSESHYGPSSLNRNSSNPALVKSLLLAGFHPNLAIRSTSKGIVNRTPSEQSVIMHPGSLNDDSKKTSTKHLQGTLFAYTALAQSNDGNTLFIRDSTQVTPLMVALFGGTLQMRNHNRLEMDGWLPFFVKASDRQFAAKLVLEFRKALGRVLNSAFRDLSGLGSRSRIQFADEPVREQFSSRLVDILDRTTRKPSEMWGTPPRS